MKREGERKREKTEGERRSREEKGERKRREEKGERRRKREGEREERKVRRSIKKRGEGSRMQRGVGGRRGGYSLLLFIASPLSPQLKYLVLSLCVYDSQLLYSVCL